MTTEAARELLKDPLVLLMLMYLATALSAIKQIVAARRDGIETPDCLEYLTRFWPETLATLAGNLLAFVALIETDTLNVASALGIGYAANSLADLVRMGGRSAALAGREPAETDEHEQGGP